MSRTDDEPVGIVAPATPGGLDPFAVPLRLRLRLSYDGTGFAGWARQPGLRSVQGELEGALGEVLRCPAPLRVAVAGRTDAGVHARGQVCHADVPAAVAEPWAARWDLLVGKLNGRLPTDIRVRSVEPAPPGFDARWSAAWRRYTYRVADPVSGYDPLTRAMTLWHRRPLDPDAMTRAAAPFVGEHDFAAFCRAREGASTVRTILELSWSRAGAGAWGYGPVVMEIRADAFCHSMVRALVGVFLAVGDGRWPVTRPAELLAAAKRVPAVATAPAHGLCLAEVGYPPDAQLADQAVRSRRWRGPADR